MRNLKTGLAFVMVTLMLSGAAWARDFHLAPDGSGTEFTAEHPGSFAEFSEVKHRPQEPVKVILADGVYRLGSLPQRPCHRGDIGTSAIELMMSPTIVSASGDPAKCVLDGENAGTGRFLTVGPKGSISGITFRNFTGGDRGGSLFAVWSVTVSNCVFTGGSARRGGAVANGEYFDCVFSDNTAEECGGAIYGAGTVKNCRFEGNRVMCFDRRDWNFASGGAVAADYPFRNPVCIDCVFKGNATAGDPARRTAGPWVTLSNCTVVSEHSRVWGKRGGPPYVNSVRVKPGDSLVAARDRLRRERDPNGRAEIVFADGVYHVATNDILWLDRHDDFLTLRAEHPGKVRLSGAFDWRLKDFRPLTDRRLLARLMPSARNKVVAVRLSPDELKVFDRPTGGEATFTAFQSWHDHPPYCDLPRFFWQSIPDHWACSAESKPVFIAGGDPQPAARWPNAGSTRGNLGAWNFKYDEADGGLLQALDERVARWDHTDGLAALVCKPAAFSTYCAALGKWDAARRGYAGKFNVRYLNDSFFEQVLEELDQPGEWAVDLRSGWLCFYPRPGMTENTACSLAHLVPPLLILDSVVGVEVAGIDFVNKVGCPAVMGSNSDVCRIERCRVRNSFSNGITFTGNHNRIVDVDVINCNSGISILGGDSRTLQNGENLIENCLVANRTILRTSGSGVTIFGCGNTLRRSTVAHVPHGALNFGGPQHTIEFNRFFDTCSLVGDAGAVYNNGGWLSPGSVIRNNDIACSSGYGVYLDDGASCVEVSGNVIRDTACGVFMGGGRENVITNNVILHSNGIQLDNRGLWWPSFRNRDGWQADMIKTYNITGGVWLARYPTIGRWHERGTNMFAHTDNVFKGNLFASRDRRNYCCNLVEVRDLRGPEKGNVSEGNLSVLLSPPRPCEVGCWRLGGIEFVQGSPAEPYDLGFVDCPESTLFGRDFHWRRGDFTLKADAKLKRLMPGFTPIAWSQVGIYADGWRKSGDAEETHRYLREAWDVRPDYYFAPNGRGEEYTRDEPGRFQDFCRSHKFAGDARFWLFDGTYTFDDADYENAGKYFGEHRRWWDDSAVTISLHPDASIAIRSLSQDPAKCVFDGRKVGKGRALMVSGVDLIAGITFRNFSGAKHGGAIMSVDRSATVSNCVFEGNSAVRGGAVFGDSVVDCVFRENRAADSGGAVCGAKTVRDCVFTGNVAATNAAAVAADYPYVEPVISRCTYKDNSAPEGKYQLIGPWCKEVETEGR